MKTTPLLLALLALLAPSLSMADGDPAETISSKPSIEQPQQVDVPAPASTACNFDHLIGKKDTEIDRTEFGDRVVRSLKPNQMVTMEYLEGRINLQIDDNGIIKAVTCG